MYISTQGLGAARRGARVIPVPRARRRGMGDAPQIPDTATCSSCCGYSNWPAAMKQQMCARGAPTCPDNCWYLRAGATCPNTIGDCNNPNNASSDCDMYRQWGSAVFPPASILGDICGNQGTPAQYYGPWDPARTYATGDTVWDTCGQLYSLASGGRWFKQGVTVIGAGKVGTTGCVGPLGTSDMNPGWMSAITQQSAPWFASPSTLLTPAPGSIGAPIGGPGQPAPGDVSGGVNPAAAASSALSASFNVGGVSVPVWLAALAAAGGLFAISRG